MHNCLFYRVTILEYCLFYRVSVALNCLFNYGGNTSHSMPHIAAVHIPQPPVKEKEAVKCRLHMIYLVSFKSSIRTPTGSSRKNRIHTFSHPHQ